MADIAFLLLVFFLVTTTMDQQKGLRVQLPPYPDPNVPPPVVEQNDRNVLEVLVNSADQLLVERKPLRLEALTDLTKKHIQKVNIGEYQANIEERQRQTLKIG